MLTSNRSGVQRSGKIDDFILEIGERNPREALFLFLSG